MDKSIFTGELFGEKISIQRISKAKAKKMFVDGQTIYLQPSNMIPFNVWQSVCNIQLDTEDLKSQIELSEIYEKRGWETLSLSNTPGKQFDRTINEYSYYNCDNERGNYIHFYAKVQSGKNNN